MTSHPSTGEQRSDGMASSGQEPSVGGSWNAASWETLSLGLINPICTFVRWARPNLAAPLGTMFLVLLSAVAEGEPSRQTAWAALFNGRDLEGWQGYDGSTNNWKAEDGLLVCNGKEGCRWLMTVEKFDDFELRLEFRLRAAGNSGVALRAPLTGDPAFDGLEVQLLDDHAPIWAHLKPTQYTGSIYDVQPPSKNAFRKAGQWQSLSVRCVGHLCQVTLNGTVVVNTDLNTYPHKVETHPGLLRRKGHLGLQNYSLPVEFRHLYVRRLDEHHDGAEENP